MLSIYLSIYLCTQCMHYDEVPDSDSDILSDYSAKLINMLAGAEPEGGGGYNGALTPPYTQAAIKVNPNNRE